MKDTQTLNILIVEDHPQEMVYCCELLREICPGANLLQAQDSSSALSLITQYPVDLALLDVSLPDLSGFQLASRIREEDRYAMLTIVFVTADAASELEAFRRFHCYQYITKPFTREGFRRTIEPLVAALLVGHTQPPSARERLLYLDEGDAVHMLPLSDILYVECMRRRLIVHTNGGQVILRDRTLSSFLNYVDDPAFLQCHRAFAVNTTYIRSIHKDSKRNWHVTLTGSTATCPVSRTYYPAIGAALSEGRGE